MARKKKCKNGIRWSGVFGLIAILGIILLFGIGINLLITATIPLMEKLGYFGLVLFFIGFTGWITLWINEEDC